MKVFNIRPKLYQRGRFHKLPLEEKRASLNRLGVKLVINLCPKADPDLDDGLVKYIHCPIPDSGNADFSAVEELAIVARAFIKAGKGVLVHCNAGRNRSALLNAILLMDVDGLSGEEAVQHIRSVRKSSLSTSAFVDYLTARMPRPQCNTILNIRGTNGSGKSTIVHKLLNRFGRVPIYGPDNKIWGYSLPEFPIPLYVVGRYETVCGGIDAMPKTPGITPKIVEFIKDLSKTGSVVFEGLLIWGIDRYMSFTKTGSHFIAARLDTPKEVCVARVLARRKSRGNLNPFDPNRTLYRKYDDVLRNGHKLASLGVDVREIPYKKSVSTILNWLLAEGSVRRYPRTRRLM